MKETIQEDIIVVKYQGQKHEIYKKVKIKPRSKELESFAFFGEYGCPRGYWSLSKPLDVFYDFAYSGQKIDRMRIPTIDCVKDMKRVRICEGCAFNGKVHCSTVSIWQNYQG